MTDRVVKVLGGAALLYAARRYFRDWGTTKAESGGALPGDELVKAPVLRATEGIWIGASAEKVWPWLVQMGQNRGGLYSFEKVENMLGLQYRNADTVHPEWQNLAVGDTVRLVPRGWLGLPEGVTLRVAAVVEKRTVVLRGEPSRLPWDVVWSFHLIPHWDDRCRLLIRSRLALRHPGEVVAAELVGPARALITRGMLVGIKRRVESEVQAEASAATASARLHGAV